MSEMTLWRALMILGLGGRRRETEGEKVFGGKIVFFFFFLLFDQGNVMFLNFRVILSQLASRGFTFLRCESKNTVLSSTAAQLH